MDELNTTTGIVALGAAGLAAIGVAWAVVLSVKLRRLRAAQRAVVGVSGQRDLVKHAAALENAFVQLRDWVEDVATGLEGRMADAERRIDGCVSHMSLIRYDAWGEMSGRQSSTLALLDASRTGVVISSISHRDQARVYVKQLRDGESEHELSPEEVEAVEAAMASTPGAASAPSARAET